MSRLAILRLILLTTLLVGLAYQLPVDYLVDVGGNDSAYVAGFYPREQGTEMNWRWTNNSAQIIFHNAGQIVPQARLRIRLGGSRPEGISAPRVSLALNDQPLDSFVASPEFTIKTYAVDAADVGGGDWRLNIASDTFQSAQDGRTLGVQVDGALLESIPAPLLPPAPTLLYALFSTLALFVLASQRLTERMAFVAALAFAFSIALALAFAREVAVLLLPALTIVLLGGTAFYLARRVEVVAKISAAFHSRYLEWLPLVVGVVLAALGQIGISFHINPTVGIILLVAGAAAFFLTKTVLTPTDGVGRTLSRRSELILIGGITALALFLRLYQLDAVPFAIFRDEARHGLTALHILSDANYRPLFIGPPISQPTPYFFALAGAFEIFGVNLFALRLVSALAGALAVPLLWLLAREIFDARVALLAALGLAISSWQISISRFAMPYVEPTIFALPAYFFLWRGIRSRRLLDWALAGLLIAAAQYAAQTSKVLFLVAAVVVADELFTRVRTRDSTGVRFALKGLLVASIVGMVALIPLINYVITNPNDYFARPEQVAIWSEANSAGDYVVAAVGTNLAKYAGMFNLGGDPNGRHYLPGAPFLDPVFGVFFVLGMVVVLQNLRRAEFRFVLAWLIAGLIPGILTVDAPSALRTIEAAPPTFVVAALGALAVWEQLRAWDWHRSSRALALAAAVLLTVALTYNFGIYFVTMYESPSVWRKYGPIGTQVGETLNALRTDGIVDGPVVVYVPRAFLENDDERFAAQFLTRGQTSFRAFDSPAPPALSPNTAAAFLIPNYPAYFGLVAAAEQHSTRVADRAAADEARWRSQFAPYLSDAKQIVGANFPASDAPTFWLYIAQ